MLFHSSLKQDCFMSLFTLNWREEKEKKKQRPVLKPIKRFTPTLWQRAAWLVFQIGSLQNFGKNDLFSYCLDH